MNEGYQSETGVPSVTLTNPDEQERSLDAGNDQGLGAGEDLPNDFNCSEPGTASTEMVDSLSHPSDRSIRSHRSSSSTNMQQQQAKKKNKFWYHALTTTYKTKHQDFRRIFYGTPVSENERLLVDFACALSKATTGLLLQGRMYITVNWICFYSKIIAYETKLTLDVRSILSITKEKTARVFPNAIQIQMERGDKYFFTSFASRDRTYQILSRIVQGVQSGQVDRLNALVAFSPSDEMITDEEFWEQVHETYGDDLGLDSAEEVDLEYCCPPGRRPVEHHLPEASSNDPPPNVDLEEVNEVEEDEDDEDDDEDEDISQSGVECNHGMSNGNVRKGLDSHERNLNSLHLETPTPTQGINNTSTEDTEPEEDVPCKGHEHLDNEYLNTVIHLPLETVFDCIFTDSPFFHRVTTQQRTFAVTQSAWPEDPDENGEKERTIYYTLRLSNALGPKTSPTVEKQILLRPAYADDERRQVTVDAKVRNGGVPYCDSFHVVNRYCLSRRSSKRTGLKVTSRVVYDKSIFFPAKTLIENTAKKGLGDYFEMIRTFLNEEASGLTSTTHVAPLGTMNRSSSSSGRKGFRKLKRRNVQNSSEYRSDFRGIESDGDVSFDRSHGGHEGNSVMSLIMSPERSWQFVIVLGLLLCLVFAVLYSKFLDVERITNDMYRDTEQIDSGKIPRTDGPSGANVVPQFSSAQDWASILKHQDSVHRSELKRWRAVVDGTVTLMEEMRASLLRLRDTLDNLEKMSPASESSSKSAPLTR